MQCSDDGTETHNVRRKFYLPGSLAGKGAKWEWVGDADDWHTYDMEVQCLIEEAWARVRLYTASSIAYFIARKERYFTLISYSLFFSFSDQGEKTIDVSKSYLGFPYIINFCNLTQVRCCTGYVRPIRRVQQAPYPLVKVALEELPPTTGRRGLNAAVKNSHVKVPHKKLPNGTGKKNSKKVNLEYGLED